MVAQKHNNRENQHNSGNNIICDTIECFASMATLPCPKKRTKVEDLSTITIGYRKDKHPERETHKNKDCEFCLTLDVALQ